MRSFVGVELKIKNTTIQAKKINNITSTGSDHCAMTHQNLALHQNLICKLTQNHMNTVRV